MQLQNASTLLWALLIGDPLRIAPVVYLSVSCLPLAHEQKFVES